MLGSLARKLRIFGFDTVYDKDSDDSTLLVSARLENRTLVTCDKELHKIAIRGKIQSILLNREREEDKMVEVARRLRFPVGNLKPEDSRCPLCNGILRSVSSPNAPKSVPQRIRHQHPTFYVCKRCEKAYWEGSHWKKLTTLSAYVEGRSINF